jgi:hypothetical protein
MGASCFTRRVRKRQVPKGFQLPHDQQKYDGTQEPESWLTDYLQRSKYSGLQSNSYAKFATTPHQRSTVLVKQITQQKFIGNWNELEKQFISDFRSTYTRPASLKELKACTQKSGESLRSYIQHWSTVKYSAEDVYEERAIDAFILIANRFADGEDAYHNKRARSPKEDRPHRYNS